MDNIFRRRGMYLTLFVLLFDNVYGQSADELAIQKVALTFSENLVAGNYGALMDAYWDDAVLLPPGRDIIKGKAGITAYWIRNRSFKQLYHKTISEKIEVTGDYALDYGYWFSEGKAGDKAYPLSSGKYVVIWKKIDGRWKMYQDIWNNRSQNWTPERPD